MATASDGHETLGLLCDAAPIFGYIMIIMIGAGRTGSAGTGRTTVNPQFDDLNQHHEMMRPWRDGSDADSTPAHPWVIKPAKHCRQPATNGCGAIVHQGRALPQTRDVDSQNRSIPFCDSCYFASATTEKISVCGYVKAWGAQ